MKYKTQIKAEPIPEIQKFDLFGIHPYSELGCEFVVVFDSITGEPVANLKVESENGTIFKQSQAVNDLIAIGYGKKFVLYDLENKCKRFETSFELYFDCFIIDGEDIFVTSESEVLKIKLSGYLEWKTKDLGIDGVIISEISKSEIIGEGEWDPPGGWKPFVIDRETGLTK